MQCPPTCLDREPPAKWIRLGSIAPELETVAKLAGRFVQAAVGALDFYEGWTAVKQPLPKFDLVAVPGKLGAMENWGLLLFDEFRFLLNHVRAGTGTAASTPAYVLDACNATVDAAQYRKRKICYRCIQLRHRVGFSSCWASGGSVSC